MRKLLSVIIVYLVGWIPMFPCTSAVVSGRVTPDGRPLLWKHRDASDLNNRIVHFEAEGGKLEFVGLVNGVDTMANEVWAGYNTSGFAIMNTASYNLKNDTSSLSDREGVVMKQVLGECRTVEDFARLLDSLPRPIGVEANFGVVDALGGAALYLNSTGNDGMATAGSGDVLTGVIGSLLAQGLPAFEAASKGVFLHGLAGDEAALKKGKHGMIASDLIENLWTYLE